MARMTQKKAVLEWLRTGASITSMEAFKQLGVTRLSAIIFNLRRNGCDIEAEDVPMTNRFGNKVMVARYHLKSLDDAKTDEV